ncbi:SpoIIE family protein phosphatase [candidate division GN15 bacterium]|nr:SpoIIE family protein phosphatase [candidate division GN15 bacterium]
MESQVPYTRTEKLLLEAARAFNSTLEYEELIPLVLSLVITAVDAEAALVYRLDRSQTQWKIRWMKRPEFKMHATEEQAGAGIVGWVIEHRDSALVNDAPNDPRLDRNLESVMGMEFRQVLALPLIGRGQLIGVIEAINKTDGEFTEADLDILTGLDHQIAVAIDNVHNYREMKREALEKTLLFETSKKLSTTLSLDEVLKAIMDSLQQVMDYVAGGVFLIGEDQSDVSALYSVGYADDHHDKVHLKVGQGLIGAVIETGDPVIVSNVLEDKRYVDANPATRSEIVVPIQVENRVIGAINLESDKLNAYDERDVALISAFANQAAISIERARLHESLLEKQRLDEQLNVAREIQRTFLPDGTPRVPGYQITGQNVSSGQVGGDYYDFIRIIDDHLGVAIADVSGKGMPAALIMASFRASLIAEIRNNYSLRTIAEKVNALLCESIEPGNYVTGVYGVLDAKNHIFTFCNFGHNPPILLRADDTVEYLTEGGPVFGVTRQGKFEQRALMLYPGDIIVMFTDGVTEVFDKNGNDFGPDRLVQLIKKHRQASAVELEERIHEAVRKFAAPDHVFDDFTMVVIKRLAD